MGTEPRDQKTKLDAWKKNIFSLLRQFSKIYSILLKYQQQSVDDATTLHSANE